MSSKLKSDLGFKKLIKCHKCGYMCRISWKECPICKSYIKKRSSRYWKERRFISLRYFRIFLNIFKKN